MLSVHMIDNPDLVTYLQLIQGHWPSSAAPDNVRSPFPCPQHSLELPVIENITFDNQSTKISKSFKYLLIINQQRKS